MEYIDVYDRNRISTGKAVPRQTHLSDGKYRLVVHICLFNTDGKLLIQHRSKNKHSFGGKWDVSAGGHSQVGEDSAAAASRELFEELGIKNDFSSIDPVMCVNFKGGFDDYYAIETTATEFVIQKSELTEVKWVNREEIFEMIDSGEFIPYHKSFFSLLFDMYENGLDFLRM